MDFLGEKSLPLQHGGWPKIPVAIPPMVGFLQGKPGRSTAFVITLGERSVTGTVWTLFGISRIEAT